MVGATLLVALSTGLFGLVNRVPGNGAFIGVSIVLRLLLGEFISSCSGLRNLHRSIGNDRKQSRNGLQRQLLIARCLDMC